MAICGISMTSKEFKTPTTPSSIFFMIMIEKPNYCSSWNISWDFYVLWKIFTVSVYSRYMFFKKKKKKKFPDDILCLQICLYMLASGFSPLVVVFIINEIVPYRLLISCLYSYYLLDWTSRDCIEAEHYCVSADWNRENLSGCHAHQGTVRLSQKKFDRWREKNNLPCRLW